MAENETGPVEAAVIQKRDDEREYQMAPANMQPMQMVATMVMNGASQDQLDKMMNFVKEMDAIQARKAYAQAMAAFRGLVQTVIRSGKGHTGTYAKLSDIEEQIRPALAQCQLTPSWRIVKDEKDWIAVECRITHGMGHYESTSFGGPPDNSGAKNLLQQRASTVSYLERYTLKALLGLTDKDDDGSGGAPNTEPEKPKTHTVSGSDDEKRRLADLFRAASGAPRATKAQLADWYNQLLALVKKQTVAEYAEWFENNGTIKDGKVAAKDEEPHEHFRTRTPRQAQAPRSRPDE
jgi:hypothetical protein